jgi:hypothetical protein
LYQINKLNLSVRLRHFNIFIGRLEYFSTIKKGIAILFFLLSFLFVSENISAQAIVETFEEAAWSSAQITSVNSTTVNTGGGVVTLNSFGTISISAAASAANQTITTYTSITGGSVSLTTIGISSAGTSTWAFSRASTTNTAGNYLQVHSANTGIQLSSGEGFLITPIISGGVATVTFWLTEASGPSNVWVGLRTNTTASPIWPTTNGSGGGGTGGLTALFSVCTTSFTNGGTISQVSWPITGTLSSVPAQIAIASITAGPILFIDDITLTAACVPYTWTGAVDSNWSVAGNWTCGTLPGPTNNVIIPAVARLPILTANTTINSIVINSGATVGLNAYTFTINGALTGGGKFIAASPTSPSGLIFGGASTGTVLFTTTPGYLSILTLNDGANITLGSSTEIVSTGTVTVGSSTGATLTSNGRLILNSNDNGSARVAQVPVSSGTSLSSIVGNVQVLTYIHSVNSSVSTARRAWRLLTAPITDLSASPTCTIYSGWQLGGVNVSGQGTMITTPAAIATGGSGNGMDAGINSNYSMYTWNVSTQKLVAVTNTKVGISGSNGSADNIGYFIFVRGDRTPNTVNLPWLATINNTTLTSSGPLQLGDQKFTSASGALSSTINGLSLIGNPYACSIDFSELAGDKTGYATSYLGNITNRFYVWNSNLTGTQKVGGYVCIDDAGNTKTYTKSLGGSGSASAADLSIQSGQAFFVMTTATGADSVTFKELTKNNTNNYIYRPEDQQAAGTQDEFGATLSLLNSDGTTSLTDGVVAQFKNSYCDCVDYMDAPKFSNIDEMFSLARYGKQLAIERRPAIVSTDTLFLNLKQMAQRSYQFGLTLNMPNHPGLGARLEDDYLGTKKALNMNGSDTANFTMDANVASQDTGRFKIVFGAVNIAPVYITIKATQEANTVLVQWSVSNDQQMTGYVLQKSTDGINYVDVYTTTALHTAGAAYSWLDTNPVAGTDYYRVLSTNELNEESYSSVVSVTIPTLGATGITVYPNPIQNGIIGLAFNNMPQGSYRYRLLDDIGQELQSGTVDHPDGNATTEISLAKLIAKGTYELEIFLPDGDKTIISVVY